MKKIRIDNDFIVLWQILRAGEVEDFSEAVDKKVFIKVRGKKTEITSFEQVAPGLLRVEMAKEHMQKLGQYSLEFNYRYLDPTLKDGDLKCAVDTQAFYIVSSTSQSDEVYEISLTSDLLIGLKGDKGDPFTLRRLHTNNLMISNRLLILLQLQK